jgi:hypothetical protein
VLTGLVATCKRLGHGRIIYLRDLLNRVATHRNGRIAKSLPDRWKTAQ